MRLSLLADIRGVVAVALLGFAFPAIAFAQAGEQPAPKPGPPPDMTQNCPGLVAADRPRVIPAAFDLAALNADQVRLTFIGHATFLIESPQLVRIATDYNDYVRPPVLPDIVTMNHAHDTHFTDHPDPAIKYVLRGWGPSESEPARHDIQVRDVRVRNVPTNIRNWNGGTERNGNSIFIFEIANMCIAHLGHLHHVLTPEHLADIGQLDVVMVPVDGTWTMDQGGMLEVIAQLHPRLLIPMHYFGARTLELFLSRVRESYAVKLSQTPSITLSRATLPTQPEVLVLPGY